MWPIALIVGVAAVASVTLLIIGVALAITVERRRYRKYIERHTAGALFSTSPEITASIHGFGHGHEQSLHQSRTTLRNTSKTWVTLPSTENVHQDLASDARPPLFEETRMATRKLRKTLKGPVQKKHRNQRRGKRTKPFVKLLNSPLSAITEHSDRSFTPQNEETEISSTGHNNVSSAEPTMAIRTVIQSPAQISFPVMNNPNQITMTSHPAPLRRSCSMTTTLSMAPGAPLPPLPVKQPILESKFRSRARTLSDSVHSVSSSVLEATPVSLHKGMLLVEKTQSQALQDFDFQLNSTTRWRSPVQVIPQSPNQQDHRAVSNLAMSAVVNKNKQLKRSFSENMELTPLSNKSRTSAVKMPNPDILKSSKYGLYDYAGTPRRYSTINVASSSNNENDPFVINSSSQLISFSNRTPLKELDPQSVQQRSTISSTIFPKAIGRHDSSVALNPTFGSQICQLEAGPYSSKSQHSFPSAELTRKDQEQRKDDPVSYVNNLDGGKSCFHREKIIDPSCWLPQKITAVTDCRNVSPPNTPGLDESVSWQFNIIPPDTPRTQLKQSPLRFHESPILPSPAYSSAKLRDHPRASRVRGPRSPKSSHAIRSQSQSPIKSRQLQLQGTKSSATSATQVRKNLAPNDLRKSIQLLRGMNSEARLLSAQHAAIYNQLGDPKVSTVGWPTCGEQIVKSQEQPNVTPLPSSKDFLSPQTVPAPFDIGKDDRKRSLVLSRSPTSVGETSIWEDVSVRDESPNAEVFASVGAQRRPSSTETVDQYRGETPENCIEDYDEYEKFVQNYGRRQSALQDRKNITVGLGVQVEHGAIPDTPQSMYDENGFLRD